MLAINNEVFTVGDLRKSGDKRFSTQSRQFLAGRCLLDTVEYLRTNPKIPGTFLQLVNAHAMRLLVNCIDTLERANFKRRIKPQMKTTCQQLLESGSDRPPSFGDDFWDWAYTIEALIVVAKAYPDLYMDRRVLKTQADLYYKEVAKRVLTGLTFDGKAEWFGPAVPVAAHRVLSLCKKRKLVSSNADIDKLLERLQMQALTRIEGGRFMGKKVYPTYHHWHYGQVVYQFGEEAEWQKGEIRQLDSVNALPIPDRAYALARVIQGAFRVADEETIESAIGMLYECERQDRPLGTGIIGETIKGSLNVLEALWPLLNESELAEAREMLDALLAKYKEANTIGIVLAVERELDECKHQFKERGGVVREEGDVVEVDHEKYRALIAMGKATAGAQDATAMLTDKYGAKWLIMVGIAGSLGRERVAKGRRRAKGKAFRGPQKGDVVIAACTAPYGIRDKVRRGQEGNVPVPLRRLQWLMIPTDPRLFVVALQASQQSKGFPFEIHQGLIVSGTGIKDDPKEKERVLAEWPGGLAIEEESYIFTLVCASRGKPYVVFRGISDLAKGDKIEQQEAGSEDRDQRRAARNAIKLALQTIELLSETWGGALTSA